VLEVIREAISQAFIHARRSHGSFTLKQESLVTLLLCEGPLRRAITLTSEQSLSRPINILYPNRSVRFHDGRFWVSRSGVCTLGPGVFGESYSVVQVELVR
jgi:hypothetical protein